MVGGGPGGLSTAYYLVLMDKVTIYEERRQLGGMMRYVIPSYHYPVSGH